MKTKPNHLREQILVDCRHMEPPEPMIAVLKKVEHMQPDQEIIMWHRKEPRLLIGKLKERGCDYLLKHELDGSIKLSIWKSSYENQQS